MEIKLGELLESRQALRILKQTRGFESAISYRILKNLKAIEAEEKIYEEQRIALCMVYANKDENGKPIIKDKKYDIPEEKMQEYTDAVESIRKETVEIQIKKVTLEDIDCARLSPAQLETIEYMLEL